MVMARYRPGAVRSPFVDRDDVLARFDELLDHPGTARLLVLTGVGGIGKSRILHEFRRRAGRPQADGSDRRKLPSALINLQEPAQRTHISALASLRTQFGSAKVRFDRFDIAYAVWWQRTNPQVALTAERLPFARTSEAVTEVLQEVSEVPIFGSAVRDQAGKALDEGIAALERCGYRSGRARAELVRALWHARAGRADQARDSVAWAVEEFERTEVYPTLVMLAAVLLDRIGMPDPGVTAAAQRAVSAIQPPRGMPELRQAIREVVRRVTGDEWDQVYAQAASAPEALSGFYHRNVRAGHYLMRIPLAGAELMDLRIWPEPAVLDRGPAIRPDRAAAACDQ